MIGDINMPIIDKKELREIRKQKFAQMEQQLKEIHPNEKNRLFYHHSSEDSKQSFRSGRDILKFR
jgi:hypothetical protein